MTSWRWRGTPPGAPAASATTPRSKARGAARITQIIAAPGTASPRSGPTPPTCSSLQGTDWLGLRRRGNILALFPDPPFLSWTSPAVQSWFASYGASSFSKVGTIPKSQVPFNSGGKFDTTITSPAAPIFDLVSYAAPQDAGGDTPQNTYFLTGRFDYNLSQNTHLFCRYGRESLATLPGGLFASPYPQYNVGQTIYNNNFLLSANHTFGSNLLSTTKLSYFRDDEAQNYNTALQETPTLLIYNIPSGSATINGQPIQFPGFFDFNSATGGLPFGGPQNTIQIEQYLSWTHGRHHMRYGGQFNYIQLDPRVGAYAHEIYSLGKSNIAHGLDHMIDSSLYQFQKAINPAGQFPCGVRADTGCVRCG